MKYILAVLLSVGIVSASYAGSSFFLLHVGSSGGAAPGIPGGLLLEDNVSFLLLEDNTSNFCLEGGC
jgi:hypothetical protein